jgi:guanine nucleotide-binding protein subunit alpha, other
VAADDVIYLGAGESGKSTVIKQMRIIHTGGFHDDERQQTKAVIYSNMIVAFRVLLEIMETEDIAFAHEKTKVYADLLETADADLEADMAFTDDSVKDAMARMWLDEGVQKAVAKGHEYALNDNLSLCALLNPTTLESADCELATIRT